MVRIGSKLQKQGVIMALFTLGLIHTGCEERIEGSVSGLPKGTPIDVELSFGFADEVDGASLCPPTDTRATAGDSNDEAFNVQLVPTRPTKAGLDEMNTSKPDKLYNLEIWQFDRSGKKIGGKALASELAIDAKLTVTLTANDDCQLLVVARGASGDIPTLNSSTYSNLTNIYAITQKALTSNVNKCTPTVDGMKNMPYYLFLDHVKVIQESGSSNGTIQSPDGTERYDVRLMLKRLAVQLKVDWEFGGELKANGYTLKEVKLCQVPADYRILQQTEQTETWGEVYPTSVANFIDYYRLKETGSDETLADANGTKTVWMPANARGINYLVAGEKYRNKEYAEAASTYLEFVVYNKDNTERTYFRAYLGGNKTTDFNLLENTNYYWKIKLSKIDYNDGRIQALSQTPVVSTNLQPTANCFMIKPGTDICFNPYLHEAGTNGWNTYLTDESGNIQADKTIDNVKILWQTKDAGTAGELVVGYSVSKDSHVNLVSLNNGDNSKTARINVKVPVSKGGNAVIAAYHQGTIVWSWHLWITDYVPQCITSTIDYAQAQARTQNGSVHQYATTVFSTAEYKNRVVMDRNLCATAGGFPGKDASDIEYSRRIGFQYEWGRKDPFFGSVDGTANEIDVIYDGDGVSTRVEKIAYGDDIKDGNGNALVWSIQHPQYYIYNPAGSWYDGALSNTYQSLYDGSGKKALYDPCPNGWILPNKEIGTGITMNNAYWYNGTGFVSSSSTDYAKGGRLYNLTGNTGVPDEITIHNTAWFPMSSYRKKENGVLEKINRGYMAFLDMVNGKYYYIRCGPNLLDLVYSAGYPSESISFRCIQDK